MMLPHERLFEALNFIIISGITLSLLAGLKANNDFGLIYVALRRERFSLKTEIKV